MTLQGKVAVVTGAGRGIGQGIAELLGAQGMAVAAWDLDEESAESTAQGIRDRGGRAIGVGGDSADSAAVAASAKRTRDELGTVSVLVNNAGITAYEPIASISDESWERMIRVNLTGPFLVSREFVTAMVEDGWGRIINISSSSAQSGAPSMSHYVASKGGVMGLTRAMALELAATGVTVNTVAPGPVDTPLMREGMPDISAVEAHVPMRKVGLPADIAHAVAYLASPDAGYVTGQTIGANGGLHMS